MPAAPFDTIEFVLDTARTRLNDAIQSLGGDVLTDNQPFTTQMVNSAWRRLQRRLANLGYTVFEQETVIAGLPAMPTPDPATQVWIDWTGYFNGTSLLTSFVLPSWFISPLKLEERIAGTSDGFVELDQIIGGLPAIPQDQWNLKWDWRSNRIYMPGAVGNTDLKIRGSSYLADFTDIAATPTQPVPIVQCLSPLANYICSEMASSRGDMDAKSFDDKAESETVMIAERDLQGARSLAKVSETYKMADRTSPGEHAPAQ